MFGLFRAAADAVRLYLMRRRQFDSLDLRRHFATRYDIIVGHYSYGCFDRWRMPGPMRVGRYCSIAKTVRVAPNNHPMTALTTHPALYERQFGVVDADVLTHIPLVIEDDVWIGHNVVVLPGCKFIGRGSVIGAGAIVTRNVAAYSVVAGNPAREIRTRFQPEMIAALEASRWWEMDLGELRQLLKDRPDFVMSPTVATLKGWSREGAQ